MKITKRQLRRVIKESVLAENNWAKSKERSDILNADYNEIDRKVSYPYGRNRGDVRASYSYTRKDGQPIPDSDMAIFAAVEEDQHPLMGVYTHTVSDDGMTLRVSYYKHTAG